MYTISMSPHHLTVIGLKLYLALCLMSGQEEVKNKVICDIEDQYTNHSFASKGTRVMYLNPYLQYINRLRKVHLMIALISESVTFDQN